MWRDDDCAVGLFKVASAAVAAEQWGLCAAQEALRRYKDEVAADPDTESGFYYNTNAQNQTKQYVLVGLLLPPLCIALPLHLCPSCHNPGCTDRTQALSTNNTVCCRPILEHSPGCS